MPSKMTIKERKASCKKKGLVYDRSLGVYGRCRASKSPKKKSGSKKSSRSKMTIKERKSSCKAKGLVYDRSLGVYGRCRASRSKSSKKKTYKTQGEFLNKPAPGLNDFERRKNCKKVGLVYDRKNNKICRSRIRSKTKKSGPKPKMNEPSQPKPKPDKKSTSEQKTESNSKKLYITVTFTATESFKWRRDNSTLNYIDVDGLRTSDSTKHSIQEYLNDRDVIPLNSITDKFVIENTYDYTEKTNVALKNIRKFYNEFMKKENLGKYSITLLDSEEKPIKVINPIFKKYNWKNFKYSFFPFLYDVNPSSSSNETYESANAFSLENKELVMKKIKRSLDKYTYVYFTGKEIVIALSPYLSVELPKDRKIIEKYLMEQHIDVKIGNKDYVLFLKKKIPSGKWED